MKSTRNVLFALLLLGVSAGAANAQLSVGAGVRVGGGQASVDLGFFYDNLAQYGNWIERPNHGWVWTPRDVAASWRPYQAGHWVWSDQGWTWLSDEPYGWATYHYGRWYQDPEIGWAWVPGNDWAPAWVSWQEGKDYVGWAPLPPGASVNASYNGAPAGPNGGYDNGPAYDNNPPYDDQGYDNAPYDDNAGYDSNPVYDSAPVYGGGYGYESGYGYGGGYGYANYAYGIAPEAYLFVPTRSFLALDLFDFFVPWVRVSSFWGFTHNCTDYGFYGGRYFNRGIPFEHVHRFYGNVPRYRLSELGGFRGRGYQVDGNRLAFFRPQVNRGWRGSPLDRPGARRSVVTAGQFRNDHQDRMRSFAQTYGRNDGRNAQRDYRPGRQAQGFRGGQQWQGQDRANRQGFYGNGQRGQEQVDRQRSFENGRVQAQRQQQYTQRQQGQYRQQQQQYTQQYRQQQQYQQQYRQQGQYRQQQQYQQQYRQPQQYRQQQQYRQAQPQQQRQQYRGDSGRGQANRGQSNRGQNDRGHGGERRQHGG